MKITIASRTFTAKLLENPTAAAFKAMLPMTINMNELNGNEKYFDLSEDLVRNASNPGTIHAGDLMLYGSNTLVLFYKTFSTPYSYTRIGHIDDITGLAAALGSKGVTVNFDMVKKEN
ncbi:cyclophilin-like fold protein [Mucilaginibacter sp. KACC 22773]|uniref:cyclophilin-like fold protein n=1 Tax=Mucilaginibacter sp. KACC 22773 TaxID=3025671 RepID=UPI0023667445|nr:cyclophilin-like fold protein [Mucilaginibacter sp. KACC 22773]WDF77210.1 cyclophilin-like fold protein [Mucilaginibacter sp. KACC 22773]